MVVDVSAVPTTRAHALAASVESMIHREGMVAGASIGTIETWRERSGFGRATVSEAMRLLVDRGIVEVRPGRGGGLFVARTGPVVRLRHTLLSVHGDATSVADALAVREALEPLLVRDAARHRTKRQVRRLRSRVHEVETALDDHDAFVRAVWALHEDIAEISPNELLRAIYLAVLRGIDDSAVRATSGLDSTDSSAEYRRHRLRVHAELVEAIAAAESDAVERALERHRGERA